MLSPPRQHRRRYAGIAALLAWSACGGTPAPSAPTAPSTPDATSGALRIAAAARGKLVGTAIQSGLLAATPYRAVVDREFDYITAEYEMKWDAIEPEPGVEQFRPRRRHRCATRIHRACG